MEEFVCENKIYETKKFHFLATDFYCENNYYGRE